MICFVNFFLPIIASEILGEMMCDYKTRNMYLGKFKAYREAQD